MDSKLPVHPEISRLIRQSEISRAYLGSEAVALRQRLDVPARIRGSLKEHPTGWLFGSLASGLAASLFFRRKPATPKKPRGFPGVLLGLTLTAARPLVKVWLADQLKLWLAGKTPSFGALPHASSKSPKSP